MIKLSERWNRYQPTKTGAFWFAVGCVAATLLVGFGPGGWMTSGSAQEVANHARNELATAVCIDKFMKAENVGAQLGKLKREPWYRHTEFISEGGWATMPDRQSPNPKVAEKCAGKLDEMKAPVAGARTSAG